MCSHIVTQNYLKYLEGKKTKLMYFQLLLLVCLYALSHACFLPHLWALQQTENMQCKLGLQPMSMKCRAVCKLEVISQPSSLVLTCIIPNPSFTYPISYITLYAYMLTKPIFRASLSYLLPLIPVSSFLLHTYVLSLISVSTIFQTALFNPMSLLQPLRLHH